MVKATDSGLFKGITLPNNGPVVSHLFYADDVVFIGDGNVEHAKNLNRILRCFFLALGLKVSPSKSKVYGIGLEEIELSFLASALDCNVGDMPFKYLRMLVGANMSRVASWKPVVDRFNAKLSRWNAKSLSFAGRVTLAKAVLGNLPTYFLCLCKALIKLAATKGSPVMENYKRFGPNVVWECSWKSHPTSESTWAELLGFLELLRMAEVKEGEDSWIWGQEVEAIFSVKTVREDLEAACTQLPLGFMIKWCNWAVPKANTFVWKCAQGRIPKRVELKKRGVQTGKNLCACCGYIPEIVEHLLISYMLAQALWWAIGV
ncbi:uncharacterized protein LOC110932300 [Helianthus annuus]|uniref:uncharacterized protein LOC110932300 n=1 Tax=Helianthus annuus TaxID=4232 RepID=UPI000B8F0B8B|nr:uncharacterized protein LOC110932300 [Helianthus annuus]